MNKTLLSGVTILLFSAAVSWGDSFTQTYSGTLTNPSTVVEENLSLSSASQLLISTNSYASGGFQPNLTLYTSAGIYVGSQQAGSPVAVADPTTGLALDSYLNSSAAAGSYIVTLTNWETLQSPTATNLSNGFTNYGGSSFIDESGATRTGNYTLTLVASPNASAAPEPATSFAALLGLAVLGIPYARRSLRARRTTK